MKTILLLLSILFSLKLSAQKSIHYTDSGVGILYENNTPVLGKTIPIGGKPFRYELARFLVVSVDGTPYLFWNQHLEKPWKLIIFNIPDNCGNVLKFSQFFDLKGYELNGAVQLRCTGATPQFYSFKVRMSRNYVPLSTSIFVLGKSATDYSVEQPQ